MYKVNQNIKQSADYLNKLKYSKKKQALKSLK